MTSCYKETEEVKLSVNSKYGVKSYLHHFYEDCSGVQPCQVQPTDQSKRSSAKRLLLYLISLLAVIIALTGLVVMILASINVTKNELFVQIMSKETMAGAVLFCCGGVITILIMTFIGLGKIKREREQLEREKFEADIKSGMDIRRNTRSPTSSIATSPELLVSLYEISEIQPTSSEQDCSNDAALYNPLMAH